MAELADAPDSKSGGKPCGFESHHRYQTENLVKYRAVNSIENTVLIYLKTHINLHTLVRHDCKKLENNVR